MEWQLVVTLAIAIPIILFPAAFIWYLNLGGIVHTMREARGARVAREKKTKPVAVETK